MTALPIAFQTNTSKYNYLGTTALVNAYAEQQGNDAKGPLAVLPAHGLSELAEVSDAVSRGFIFCEDLDCIYAVHGMSAYKVTRSAGIYTSTRLGTLPGTDRVKISRNQADPPQISVLSTSGNYYIEADIIKNVTDSDLPTPIDQDQAGGYTAYAIEDGRFFLSGLNDCSSINSLDYATAEQASDKLVGIKYDRGTLYLFGTSTIEAWRNTGAADFPFEPITTQIVQKGLIGRDAVASCDNTLMFVGSDSAVYRLGGGVTRISNHGIERLIEADVNKSSIVAFSYNIEGHSFLVVTGTDWTRTYDAATNTWHSRESYGLDVWRAKFASRAWGQTVFGDALTGMLLKLDRSVYTEDGDTMIWGVDSPTLHAYPNGGIVDAVHFDMATGYGDVSSTSQGYDPAVMLSVSKDGGNTWSGAREVELGRSGSRQRVTARRLGRFGPLGMQFRLRVSDPVARSLVLSDVQVRPLKR